jgi:hypothetical protein
VVVEHQLMELLDIGIGDKEEQQHLVDMMELLKTKNDSLNK